MRKMIFTPNHVDGKFKRRPFKSHPNCWCKCWENLRKSYRGWHPWKACLKPAYIYSRIITRHIWCSHSKPSTDWIRDASTHETPVTVNVQAIDLYQLQIVREHIRVWSLSPARTAAIVQGRRGIIVRPRPNAAGLHVRRPYVRLGTFLQNNTERL